jgi:octaprenyl-diphosphate synthase
MENGSEAQAAIVKHAIENGGREDFPEVLAAIRNSGALEHTRKAAIQCAQSAQESIRDLPDSTYKQALVFLAEFAVNRSH